MDYVGKIGYLISSLNNLYNEINPATLSGAIDIIVVEQEDGELMSSPFHVRFGKLSVLLPQEKKVEIKVNGETVPYLMKVGEAGEAYFVFETDHEIPEEFQTSPILQALNENKLNAEEPPFLDISDKVTIRSEETVENKDTFEDDEQEYIPAELQSPKMIIEEQMDKVVTKMNNVDRPEEEHYKTINQIYSLKDGSTLLERADPITTTTLTKERFIVRPLKGDLKSYWMDVTHTLTTEEDLNNSILNNEITHDTSNEKGSILLDMAGYKTRKDESDLELDLENKHSISNSVENQQEIKSSTWGWGKSHVTQETNTDQEDTVHLKSGQTYCIEMSLCGFSAFGYDQDQNDSLFNEKKLSYDDFVHNPSILNDPRLVFRYNGQYFSAIRSSPLFTSLLVFRKPLDEIDESELNKSSETRDTYSYGRGWRQWLSRSSSDKPVDPSTISPKDQTDNVDSVPNSNSTIDSDSNPNSDPNPNPNPNFNEITTFTTTTKATSVGWSGQDNEGPFFPKRKIYAKTLRLTSDQLKQLNLKKGVNTISFSVSSAYQGVATCVAKVFYWDYDIQVVISDIDGTITKSDAMGHVMAMLGKDWTHDGVAQLYTDISNNGYHFIYLTSRAIGQADYTRDYLNKILQNNYQLPDGPVIMSPDRLFQSLHREVIIRKPEVFKMACLKDIQRLFGGRDPFYAGFGNRITDAISYRSVNVPSSRIFTIDPQSAIKLELVTGFQSSYVHLTDMVDQLFPPINKTIQEEFSDYNFWKMPMVHIDIPELDELGPLPTSPKPKPIKPDPLRSLPKESIVTVTPTPKRGLFRSFTSRSSKTPTVDALAKKSPPVAPKPITSFNSAPELPTHSEPAKSELSDGDVDSIHLASPRSLPEDYTPTSDTELDDTASVRSQPTRMGIISKLFSRRTVVVKPQNIDTTTPEDNDFNDDEIFNSALDIDLDKIPFI